MTNQIGLDFQDDSPEANAIVSFDGDYRFLSNFWPCTIYLDRVAYPSVEHAYVAAKTVIPEERAVIYDLQAYINYMRKKIPDFTTDTLMHSGQVKRYGKKDVTLREGFDELRLDIMGDFISQKFANGTSLADKLLATGDRLIIEGNTWGDTFWGECNGKGENHLGRLLMRQRGYLESLRQEPMTP
jgi:hypothetical protein